MAWDCASRRIADRPARTPATILLVLLTLLCALCPAGLPSTQKLGSAFNPASESVTVRPNPLNGPVRLVRVAPDPREPVLTASADPAGDGTILLAAASHPAVAAPAPHPAVVRRTPFSPRAPPVA